MLRPNVITGPDHRLVVLKPISIDLTKNYISHVEVLPSLGDCGDCIIEVVTHSPYEVNTYRCGGFQLAQLQPSTSYANVHSKDYMALQLALFIKHYGIDNVVHSTIVNGNETTLYVKNKLDESHIIYQKEFCGEIFDCDIDSFANIIIGKARNLINMNWKEVVV